MKQSDGRLSIVVCMGSSCFSRGNSKALDQIEKAIEEEGWADSVHLSGCVCTGECSCGPNITIGEQKFSQIHPDAVVDLIKFNLGQ